MSAHPFTFEAFERDGLNAYLHTAYEDRAADQVYLDLIWGLTEGFARYAIPRYHRDAGVAGWGEPYALVDWEYGVEVESDRTPDPDSIRDFVPARSAVSQPVISATHLVDPGNYVLGSPSPYAAGNANKAGLFAAWRPDSLAKVVADLQCDATAELNLFAVRKDRLVGPDRLLDALVHGERPRLADVLGPEDLFVDLVIGVDMGYSNILLIQSHSDLSARLDAING
jgi:hypothetical protein